MQNLNKVKMSMEEIIFPYSKILPAAHLQSDGQVRFLVTFKHKLM